MTGAMVLLQIVAHAQLDRGDGRRFADGAREQDEWRRVLL
jgi:hypothetical protein